MFTKDAIIIVWCSVVRVYCILKGAKSSFLTTITAPVFHFLFIMIQENKKPLRYRDNQVVSTKGERFSLVKKQESEDMKKTYVNIKPARKYRFH